MGPGDVPAGPLAVDTDVFSMIHMRRGRYEEFTALISGHQLVLPFPVVGELGTLALKTGARWGEPRRAVLRADIGMCVVIPADARVTDKWSELHARFVGRLKGGGINDFWIAACCLVHALPLVTGNLSDFETIASEFSNLRLVHPDL